MLKFEKVSYEQFAKDYAKYVFGDNIDIDYMYKHYVSESELRIAYDNIELPRRATEGSAGYDFFAPTTFAIHPAGTTAIPSGIRCKMDKSVVLMLYPRSGLGFKWGMHLCNTVGVIDSDYYNSDNEGHIIFKFAIDDTDIHAVAKGKAMAQGVFTPYYITDDDDTTIKRNGGMGSTDEDDNLVSTENMFIGDLL